MAQGAFLDRDVVFTITPATGENATCVEGLDAASSEASVVRLAQFQVPPTEARRDVALKVLVDCSGSMSGERMDSAKRALHGLLDAMGDEDYLSLSRFGTTVEHTLRTARMGRDARARASAQVDRLNADLGGTEMEQALRSVFDLEAPMVDLVDVLLVTDGDIWNTAGVVAAARDSGHRVFAIGVGSSPAESLLRALAEESGGACELATPGESLEEAARRMLARIRQLPPGQLSVNWGAARPVWQTRLPKSLFGGDTLAVYAGFEASPAVDSVVQLIETAHDGEPRVVSAATRTRAAAPASGDALARLAAAARVNEVLGAKERTTLALTYQLLTDQTHCVLVHARDDADKVHLAAQLHRVPSMMAAGSSGFGAVHASMDLAVAASALPPMRFRSRDALTAKSQVLFCESIPGDAATEGLTIDRQRTDAVLGEAMALAQRFLEAGGDTTELASAMGKLLLPGSLRAALLRVIEWTGDRSLAWLLLLHWARAAEGAQPDATLPPAAQARLDLVDPALVARCLRAFDEASPSAATTKPGSRADRLMRAIKGER